MTYLLGIDVGTSATKTVLFDERGKVISSSSYEYPMYQPRPGWAEQDPDDWWKAVVFTCNDLLNKTGIDKEAILGIGVSGQMHGLVLLDEKDQLLYNSIIWCDQRTDKEAQDLEDLVGRDKLISLTANPAITGFTAAKILWVQKNLPAVYKKVRKIMLPKDYIVYKLTGEFSHDVSDGSGMQLMDIRKRDFSPEILDKLSIERKLLGQMYESAHCVGRVSKSAAQKTGLSTLSYVAAGGGDQACGAVGNGIVEEGIVSSTIGSSGVVFAHTDKLHIDPKGRIHTLCHAVPGAYHIMGVTQGAGLSLKWFRDNFCQLEEEMANIEGVDVYVILDRMAKDIKIGAEGLVFLPYLMGERSPHLDPYSSGVFFGITPMHTKAHFIRAILEGVVYSLRDSLEIIKNQMSIDIKEVRLSGGGAKSPLWNAMQADVFKSNVALTDNQEGPAQGAAILAGVASGLYKSVSDACKDLIITSSKRKYDLDKSQQYDDFYKVYVSLYPALKDNFKLLRDLL